MKRWFAFGLIIFLLTRAECQEPDDDSATRKYQDELFKAETTETTNIDINTTLSSTEIENNSTAAESGRPNDEVDAANDLDEVDELSSVGDRSGKESVDQFTTTIGQEEVTQSGEWTTFPAEHEYSISIKDVFEKSIDVVKNEMKGIGIIQSWLKEKADEIGEAITTEDYDYTQSTDEYTDVNEVYDDDQTGVTETVQKENELAEIDLAPVGNELELKEEVSTKGVTVLENSDGTLEKIEDDLERLNKVQVEEEDELQKRQELLEDIEKNLNKLEQEMTTQITNTEYTTVSPTTIVDDHTELATELPMEIEVGTEATEEIVEFTELVYKEESTDLPKTEEDEENSTVLASIMNEIDSNDTTTISPEEDETAINIFDERTATTTDSILEESKKHTNSTESEITTTTETPNELESETMKTTTESTISTTEVILMPITEISLTTENDSAAVGTTNSPSLTTEVPEQSTLFEEQSNENIQVTSEVNPQPKIEEQNSSTTLESTELPLTTVEYQDSDDIVDEIVDEIIDEIKEMEMTSTTTTEDATKLLLEETVNLTQTVDKLLSENEKVLKVVASNSIHGSPVEDSDDFTEENKSNKKESSVEITQNEDGQDIEASDVSLEEEPLDDIEIEREKIFAEHDNSEEDNTLSDDVDHDTESKEEVGPEVVADPTVSALITDRTNGDVCLNASGLSIKISTDQNLTDWVPSTARVLGECTSFGAYLNLTWKTASKQDLDNDTLSFTFIGDDEESYIEEVILKTNKGKFVATQLERYLSEPTVIDLSEDVKITLTHLNVKLNRKKKDYATISLLSVDNALALQIASGGLCLFIIFIAVSIFSYKKLRSQSKVFKVSLDK